MFASQCDCVEHFCSQSKVIGAFILFVFFNSQQNLHLNNLAKSIITLFYIAHLWRYRFTTSKEYIIGVDYPLEYSPF